MSSLLGTTLGGRYRLESRIGSGGMSTVYRAHDETLERFVAIKLMNREIASDSDQLERFRREARAVARLSHPNIVHVIDAGEDDGRPYIVFECIDGETLKERIRRLGRLPIPEAVAYSIEIARALGAAHAHHVVHRDVKPQNVLIDHEGTAKVTDFGIARTLEEEGLTADGRVLGTTDYVSPEQALGQYVTGQSDLYSLGVALYEMLTGELPYSGDNQVVVAMKHVREEIPDVRRLRPEVSATLAAVVETATAKDLSERYEDDAEMIADLEKVLALETTRAGSVDGEVTEVLRTLPPETRKQVPFSIRRRGRAAALGLIAAAIVAAAIVVLALRTHPGHGHGSKGGTVVGGPVALSHAFAYNPDASGSKTQNNNEEQYAVDGRLNTAWTTETYYDGSLNKAGVGIYVSPASATTATKLVVDTATHGWNATIYATNSHPNASSFTASNWTPIGSAKDVAGNQPFTLAGKHSYRYYLVWITALPPGGQQVSINEIRLYK
ncbi:MAG TPA: protein kinase [Solirubrobacteraceae bacterium]|jgi:serine/threonine-protein kinase|nr:protein kinase [Solirubrobacteraceae bacterium]